MPEYYYSNVAVVSELAAPITDSSTSLALLSAAGHPAQFPYVLRLARETSTEELVLVTNRSAEICTVTRAFGGTSASGHASGTVVDHVWNAVDGTDFRAHEEASTGVHGVSGALVGTANTQTLSNKTLTSPVINSGELNGVFDGDPTITGLLTALGGLTLTRATGTDEALDISVTGDTHPRVRILADGTVQLGSGAAAPDVHLSRSEAQVLGLDGVLRFFRNTPTSHVVQTRVSGDTTNRFVARSDGRLQWGDGAMAVDTNLYRAGPDQLRTDDDFQASTIVQTTGVSAAAGFQMVDQRLSRTCGTVWYVITVTRTGSNINSTSAGNITDTHCATLPGGWRPPEFHPAVCGDGFGGGSAHISPNGIINLATWSANGVIQPGRNIRISGMFHL